MLATPHQLEFIDAFAGIGGFKLGFERASMKCIAHIEKDPNCQALLSERSPGVLLKGAIEDVRGSDLIGAGRARVMAGGFPCQDTSIAAPHRDGLAGRRSGAYFEFTRLVEEYGRLLEDLDPRWVVIENPSGLLSSKRGRDMATVVRVLEDLGYGWAYRVVDARRDFGSVQNRERVLVVGHRGGDPRPAGQVLGLIGPRAETSAPCDDGRLESRPSARPIAGGDSLIRVWRKSANPQMSIEKGYEGGYRETWVNDGTARTLTGYDWGNAARQTHLIAQAGRLRTLTPTEWERLMGFPDGWTEGMPPGDVRRNKVLIKAGRGTALGNAMHVDMAHWLGQGIVEVDAALPQLELTA